MNVLYQALLLLYPREFRDQFGAEMLRVHTEAAQEHRSGFLFQEASGLLLGALRERQARFPMIPVLGGLGLAAALQWGFYAGAFRVLGAAGSALRHATIPASDPLAAPITISIFALAPILCLLPLFLLLANRVRRPRL